MNKVIAAVFLCVISSSFAQNISPLSPGDFLINGFNKHSAINSNISFSPNASDISQIINDDLPLSKSAKIASSLKDDFFSGTRSAKGANLFRNVSPSVVLVLTNDSIGTGSLINSNGEILTNWHVVGGNKEVGIIFKPQRDTQAVTKADVRRGRIVKVDEVDEEIEEDQVEEMGDDEMEEIEEIEEEDN